MWPPPTPADLLEGVPSLPPPGGDLQSEGVEATVGKTTPAASDTRTTEVDGEIPPMVTESSDDEDDGENGEQNATRAPAMTDTPHLDLEGVTSADVNTHASNGQSSCEVHKQVKAARLKCIDLCAGAGAMSLAARNLGFESALALDNNTECVQTLLNNGFTNARHGDMRHFDFTRFTGSIHLLLAGLPCQPFSDAGLRLGAEDERNLWPELIKAVATIKPETFLFETVSGFMQERFKELREAVLHQLESLGYTVNPHVVNAKNYGVAQSRKRVLLVGHLSMSTEFTAPNVTVPITVAEALKSLGEPDKHNKRRHKIMGCAREYNQHTASSHDKPAKTIVAGGKGSGGGNNLYRTAEGSVRHFTVRELARLQSFPDNYDFTPGWSRAVQQIGNACPVLLTEKWVTPLAQMLVNEKQRKNEIPIEQPCPWSKESLRIHSLHAQLDVLRRQLAEAVVGNEASIQELLLDINGRASQLETSPGIQQVSAMLVQAMSDVDKESPEASTSINSLRTALEYAQVYDELMEELQARNDERKTQSPSTQEIEYINALDAQLEPEPELDNLNQRQVPMYFKVAKSELEYHDHKDSEPLFALNQRQSNIKKGTPVHSAMRLTLLTDDGKGGRQPIRALCDTGAAVTALNYEYLKNKRPDLLPSLRPTLRNFHNASGRRMKIAGTVHIPIIINGTRVVALAYVFYELLEDMLLGQATLAHNRCSIECASGKVTCVGNDLPECEMSSKQSPSSAAAVGSTTECNCSSPCDSDKRDGDSLEYTCDLTKQQVSVRVNGETTTLNAVSVLEECPSLRTHRNVTIAPGATYTLDPRACNTRGHVNDYNFEIDESFLSQYGLMAVDAVHNPYNRRFACKVRNPTSNAIHIPADTRVATHVDSDETEYVTLMAIATYDDEGEDTIRPLDDGGIEDLHNYGFTVENAIDPDERREDGSYAPLSAERKRRLYEIAWRHHYVYSRDAKIPRISHLTQLGIPTGDAAPVSQAPYPMPHKLLPAAQAEVNKLLKAGLIEPSMSSWASPMLIRAKKDSTPEDPKVKLVIDYRRLNAVTTEDAGGLGTQGDILHYLGGKYKFIGLMDAAGGFYQFLLNPEDRHKSAFILPSAMGGTLFQWRVAPYGLTRNPAGYSRAIQHTLRGLARREDLAGGTSMGGATSWLDDICIRADSFDGFCNLFELVLGRLLVSGISLKGSKCDLLLPAIDVLGFVATPHGIKLQPSKLKTILGNAVPTSPSEVETFLGMVAFLRRMIPRASLLAAPMAQAKKTCTARAYSDGQKKKGRKSKGPRFNEEEQEAVRQSWQAVIDHLDEETTVHAPNFEDPNAEFVIVTDASDYAIGGCLLQWQHDDERGPPQPPDYVPDKTKDPLDNWRRAAGWRLVIIGYYSKTLIDAQKNYTAFDKEAGAILMCLRHWSDIITFHPTVVYTDSSVALSMLGKYTAPPRLQRWGVEIGTYLPHLRIGHRRGANNGLADLLSRFPAFEEFVKPPNNDVTLPDDLFDYVGDAKLYNGPEKHDRDDRRAYLRGASYQLYDEQDKGILSEHFWTYQDAPEIPGRGLKDRVPKSTTVELTKLMTPRDVDYALNSLIEAMQLSDEPATAEGSEWQQWIHIFNATCNRPPQVAIAQNRDISPQVKQAIEKELQLLGCAICGTSDSETIADVIINSDSKTNVHGTATITLRSESISEDGHDDDPLRTFVRLNRKIYTAYCNFAPTDSLNQSLDPFEFGSSDLTIGCLTCQAIAYCLRTRFELPQMDPNDPFTAEVYSSWAAHGIFHVRKRQLRGAPDESLEELARAVATISALQIEDAANAEQEQEEDASPSPKYAWQGCSDKTADKFPYEPTVVIDTEMQNADPAVAILIKALSTGSRSVRARVADRYELKDGLLYRLVIKDGEVGHSIVAPRDARAAILSLFHYSTAMGCGHSAGGRRLYETIREYYFWPGMEQECHDFVKACIICASRKPEPSHGAPAGTAPTPSRPFEVIHIDHKGPLPVSQGYQHILVVVCALTRFAVFIPVKNTSAEATLEALLSRVFCIFGFPLVIISDNASGFVKLGEYQCLYGYRNIHTMPHTPCANGLAESTVKKVKKLLNTHTTEYRNWVPLLPNFNLAVNNWITSATHEKPFLSLFGYPPTTLPALENPELLPKTTAAERDVYETAQRLHRLHARLQQLSDSVKEAARLKRAADDPSPRRRVEKGDQVWVKLGTKEDQARAVKKGYEPWKRSYTVLEVKPHAVRLDVPSGRDILPWQSLRKISLAAPFFHDDGLPLPVHDRHDMVEIPGDKPSSAASRELVTPESSLPTNPDEDSHPVDSSYHGWTPNRWYEFERLLSARPSGRGWKVMIKWTCNTPPTEESSHVLSADPEVQAEFERCKEEYYNAHPDRRPRPVEEENTPLVRPTRRSPRVNGELPGQGLAAVLTLDDQHVRRCIRTYDPSEIAHIATMRKILLSKRQARELLGG